MATLVLPEAEFSLEAVGLDVDGVLRDTGYHIYEASCKTIAELGGVPPSYEEFITSQGGDLVTYYAYCGVSRSKEEIYAVYDKVVPFDDVDDFMTGLVSRGVKLFVVSSHPRENLRLWFLEHKLHDHLLDFQGGSRDKPLHIQEACQRLEVNPARACYVGDWGLDMKAAIAAGALPIGITRFYNTELILLQAGAKCVVRHLSDLAGMIH